MIHGFDLLVYQELQGKMAGIQGITGIADMRQSTNFFLGSTCGRLISSSAQ